MQLRVQSICISTVKENPHICPFSTLEGATRRLPCAVQFIFPNPSWNSAFIPRRLPPLPSMYNKTQSSKHQTYPAQKSRLHLTLLPSYPLRAIITSAPLRPPAPPAPVGRSKGPYHQPPQQFHHSIPSRMPPSSHETLPCPSTTSNSLT